MIGTYLFAASPDLSMTEYEIKTQVLESFEDYNGGSGGDEYLIVLKDNRNINIPAIPDVKDGKREAVMSEAVTWDEAKRIGLEIMATEMEIFGLCPIHIPLPEGSPASLKEKAAKDRITAMSYEELRQTILTEPIEQIIKLYQDLAKDPFSNLGGEWTASAYKRKKLSQMYEHFRSSRRLPGFTDWHLEPEDYRCFDVCDKDEATAILFVEMHT